MLVSQQPDEVLVSFGLGSCVAVCLYDPVAKIGGMLHALLPTVLADRQRDGSNLTKYVDRGVPLLVEAMIKLGAQPTRLVASLCGGAQMLAEPGFNGQIKVGERNVQRAKAVLRAAHIHIRASAVGGDAGRTVKLYIVNGRVTVRTLREGEQVLISGVLPPGRYAGLD